MTSHARFSIIPGWVVTDRRLKPRDLQVLCLLGRHTDKHGWCRRSQVKMAAELECARSTVQAAIDRLADIGVVEKHVQETKSGADSAHFFRVIFDRPPPSGYAFAAWEGDENEEDNPITPADQSAPPADISAPPADPESAPPAGPESAPINDPCLTTPEKRERERGRDDENEDRHAQGASREAIRRSFNKWYRQWPVNASIPHTAEEAWFELSADERAACLDRTGDYIEWCGGKTKISTYAAVYLKGRMWEKLPPRPVATVPVENVKAFGKAGMAYRLWIMSQHEKPHPRPTVIVQQRIDEGGEAREHEIISRRLAYSWPRLGELNRRIVEREQLRVSPVMAELGADFVSTDLKGPAGQAWKRFFRKVRMPWLPVEPDYAYLPALDAGDDLDRAVAAAWWQFAERCKEHADAG